MVNLDELLKLCEAASKRPWAKGSSKTVVQADENGEELKRGQMPTGSMFPMVGQIFRHEDLEFVVALVNAAEPLIRELQAAREELTRTLAVMETATAGTSFKVSERIGICHMAGGGWCVFVDGSPEREESVDRLRRHEGPGAALARAVELKGGGS